MDAQLSARRTTRGSTTLEVVGLVAAVAVLTVALGPGIAAHGGRGFGSAVAGVFGNAVDGGIHANTKREVIRRTGARSERAPVRLRWPRGGVAAWERKGRWSRRPGPGNNVTASARVCAACITLEERHSAGIGAAAHGTRHRGPADIAGGRALTADGRLSGNLALVAVEAAARFSQRLPGDGVASAHGRATGVVGASADLDSVLVASPRRQRVRAHASGVLGARARIEQEVAVRAAGIALEQTVGAEGWAGLGGRARFDLDHQTGGRLAWDLALGGAIGLGGELDVAGSVDVSGVRIHPRQRQLLGGAAMGMANPAMAGLLLGHWQ